MDFPSPFTASIYIGNVGEEGVEGFTSHAGVLLSPMSQCHNTDVWIFLKPMLMIQRMKMMQMPYLDKRSMLLSGQVPYRTYSSQLFWNGLFQKKINRRVEDILFWKKKPWKFFCFSLYPLKFQAKRSSTPENLVKLCNYVTSLRNFKSKNLRPLEISHEFFLVFLGNSTLLLINPWKFCVLFLECSWKFYILAAPSPPVWIFSGTVQSRKPCASLNTFLYSRMKITYHKLLVDFFHNKLISMQVNSPKAQSGSKLCS